MGLLYRIPITMRATYIYGPIGKLAKRTTINGETNTFYYHNDHLGSTRLATDNNKNIVTAVTYHPFGESYSVEGEEDYLFTGKEKDSTGLYYYGARHYDPDLGRFLTRDPYIGKLVNPQSLNQYTYCYNNPLLFVDPDGRDPLHYEGPIYYDEEEKTLVYSHAPQLMGYVNCEEGYEWFACFCIIAGIILSIAAAPNLLPLLGGHLVSLAKAMAAAGSKVASAVISGLKAALPVLKGMPLKKINLLLNKLKEAVFWAGLFWKGIEVVFNCNIDIGIFKWGFMLTILDKKDKSEWGWVTILDEQDYQWRSELVGCERIYYVKINDEWVQMPDGWLPGEPIPEEYLT